MPKHRDLITKLERALGLKTTEHRHRKKKSAKKRSGRRMPPRGKNGKFKSR
jgi:hypothetical protein